MKRADLGLYELGVSEFPQPPEPDCATIESVTQYGATGYARVASQRMLTQGDRTPARSTEGEFPLTESPGGLAIPDTLPWNYFDRPART